MKQMATILKALVLTVSIFQAASAMYMQTDPMIFEGRIEAAASPCGQSLSVTTSDGQVLSYQKENGIWNQIQNAIIPNSNNSDEAQNNQTCLIECYKNNLSLFEKVNETWSQVSAIVVKKLDDYALSQDGQTLCVQDETDDAHLFLYEKINGSWNKSPTITIANAVSYTMSQDSQTLCVQTDDNFLVYEKINNRWNEAPTITVFDTSAYSLSENSQMLAVTTNDGIEIYQKQGLEWVIIYQNPKTIAEQHSIQIFNDESFILHQYAENQNIIITFTRMQTLKSGRKR